MWAGTRNLRATFKHDPKRWETRMYIVTFDLMIKYVCPPVLFGLFINQAVSDASVYSRGYENYPGLGAHCGRPADPGLHVRLFDCVCHLSGLLGQGDSGRGDERSMGALWATDNCSKCLIGCAA